MEQIQQNVENIISEHCKLIFQAPNPSKLNKPKPMIYTKSNTTTQNFLRHQSVDPAKLDFNLRGKN